MSTIDIEQACLKSARCHDIVRDTCLEFNVTISSEMLKGIGQKMLALFLADIPAPLTVREAALESSLKYWVSHLRAFKNQGNPEDYRKKCKEYALNIDNVFNSYFVRLENLQEIIDEQHGVFVDNPSAAPSVQSKKKTSTRA